MWANTKVSQIPSSKEVLIQCKKIHWVEPYLFRECAYHIIRWCFIEEEVMDTLHACHASPVGVITAVCAHFLQIRAHPCIFLQIRAHP